MKRRPLDIHFSHIFNSFVIMTSFLGKIRIKYDGQIRAGNIIHLFLSLLVSCNHAFFSKKSSEYFQSVMSHLKNQR